MSETNDARNSWFRGLPARRKILMTNSTQRYKHHENNIVPVRHHIQDMYGIIPRTGKCNTNNEHWCILGNLIALLIYNCLRKETNQNFSPANVCQACVAVRLCLPMQHKQWTLMHPGKPHSLATLQLSNCQCNTNNEHWCILGNLIALLIYNCLTKQTAKFFNSKCLPSLSRGTALPGNPDFRCVMKTCERCPYDRICDINEVTVPALTM